MNLLLIKWLATITLIIGATTAALNIHPLYIVLNTLGGILWSTAGVLMKDKPLVATNVFLTLIYGLGFIYAVYI